MRVGGAGTRSKWKHERSLTAGTVVGIGCNNFGGRIDEGRTHEVVDAALDVGINFFDTADMYSTGKSEELLGKALGRRRSEVIIATKFGQEMEGQGRGARPEYIMKAFQASLRRLETDYVDLYQLHLPDPDVPIAETLGALDELVRAGQAREIGCSNFSAEQLRQAEAASAARPGSARFVSVQNEYSLLHREPEDEVLAECKREGVSFLPFLPPQRRLLKAISRGKRSGGTRIEKFESYALLRRESRPGRSSDRLCESRGRTLLELAFSASRPWSVASVIAGRLRQR